MTEIEAKKLYPDVEIIDIAETDDSITIYTKSTASEKTCPFCQTVSKRIHKRYTKLLQDLPINKKPVYVSVTLRMFRCDNMSCSHKSFVEPLSFTTTAGKKTTRLINHIIETTKTLPYRKAAIALQEQGIKINDSTANKMEKNHRRKVQQ